METSDPNRSIKVRITEEFSVTEVSSISDNFYDATFGGRYDEGTSFD